MSLMLSSWLLDLIFPPRCPLCGCIICHGEKLCDRCMAQAETPRLREHPFPSVKGGLVRCWAAYTYRGRVRGAVLRMKFQNDPTVGVFFGNVLAKLIPTELPEVLTYNVVTAVPMTTWRKMQRGYNQSEYIARTVAKKLGLPYRTLLHKVRRNRTQHLLSAEERFCNVQGVYAANRAVSGRRVLLVDDVVTTGATLAECAGQLLHAGASQVLCLSATQAVLQTDKD